MGRIGAAGVALLTGSRCGDGTATTPSSPSTASTTIYPGFYRGRTIHIHFKIHLNERTAVTSQLFFPESTNEAVMATSPYRDAGARDTRNSNDSTYAAATVLNVTADGGGYAASLAIGISN
jgi:protocatechuate 3,4-dioxygenase beta subunit